MTKSNLTLGTTSRRKNDCVGMNAWVYPDAFGFIGWCGFARRRWLHVVNNIVSHNVESRDRLEQSNVSLLQSVIYKLRYL